MALRFSNVRRGLTQAVVLALVASVGLVVALAASAATVEIRLGELVVVNGTATGVLTGFSPGATVTIDARTFVADANGAVTLVSSPLDGDALLTIGLGGSTASVELRDAVTGLTLSVAEIADVLPNTTLPGTVTVEVSSGTTTTTGGTTTGSTTTGGTTTGSTTTGGTTTGSTTTGGAAAQPAGALTVSSGTSIPVSSVVFPARLIVDKVQFTPTVVRSRNRLISARVRVKDSRGFLVRDAIVFLRGIPVRRVGPVSERRTDMNGWASFKLQPTKLLPLKRGGRLTVFVRARNPNAPVISEVTGRRLVSVRLSTAR